MEVVLIVAGGSGTRMQSAYPKQFIHLLGRPVLMHTLECFFKYSQSIHIVVVLPEAWIDTWKKLIDDHNFKIKHEVVLGGSSRPESVKNGLELIDKEDVVAIHDGVRPFVSIDVISLAFKTARKHGNAVVSINLNESLRRLKADGKSEAVDRNRFRIVQTPQVFKGEIIKEAYKKIDSLGRDFTDDASLLEACGYTVNLVDGDFENIKITTPEDLVLAEAIIKNRMKRNS